MKILWFLIFYSSLAFALPAETTLQLNGSVFSYYGSHSLHTRNSDIEAALIIVHGSDRNADTYFTTGALIAAKLNQSKNILVIAPHFKLPTDALLPNELTFSDEGWLRGDESLHAPISSFEIMDEFVSLLLDHSKFPNLRLITVTGHSAGGQLTQRYAIGSRIRSKNTIIRYVVANPGSYAYLTAKRPVKNIPRACPEYNDYKYGLDHLNHYLAQTSHRKMIKRYLNRDVTYLLGEADIDTSEIDQECPAQLQGVNRLERGKNFKAELDLSFPKNHHHLVTVPGVAHSERSLYTTELGIKVLLPEPESKNKK